MPYQRCVVGRMCLPFFPQVMGKVNFLGFTLKLKGMAQAKIIKKSVILFWLLNMTI